MSNDKMREEFDAAWATGELLQLDGPFNDPRKNQMWATWQASREALPTWKPMASCPKHVDVLFFNERNGVIPGRLTDADSLMSDKERDEWDGGEEAQYRVDAFGFGHWGVDRMDGCEAPTLWMPYPENRDEKE